MSGSRIKTLVIAALVLLNLFFLTVIIIDAAADSQNERQAIINVCAVLRGGGLEINPENIKADNSLRIMRTTRADIAEETIVRAILGPTDMTVSGVIHLYENPERGTAEFYSGGDFEIKLIAGLPVGEQGFVGFVRDLLKKMALEVSDIIPGDQPGGGTVTAVSSYRGISIINCTIEFIFSDNVLQTVKGRYVTVVEPLEDSASLSHVGTALLSFLTAVRSDEREDVVCSRIDSVVAGYQHHVVGTFGEDVIIPVWIVMTDAGRYIVVDSTGEVLPVIQGTESQGLRIVR